MQKHIANYRNALSLLMMWQRLTAVRRERVMEILDRIPAKAFFYIHRTETIHRFTVGLESTSLNRVRRAMIAEWCVPSSRCRSNMLRTLRHVAVDDKPISSTDAMFWYASAYTEARRGDRALKSLPIVTGDFHEKAMEVWETNPGE